MKGIADCDNVVIVLTAEYVKSLNCMLEMLYLFGQEDWPMKAMVLVIEDSLYSTERKLEVLNYWNLRLLSIFTDLESLKSTVEKFNALNESTKAYAKGFTTIKRGISLKENKSHHVEYFLYDYEYNSPNDDFSIVEVRQEHE